MTDRIQSTAPGGNRRKSDLRLVPRGFSLLELVVVVVIISALITFALSRLLGTQGAAEAAAMESVVGSLRSALGMQVAEYIAKGQMARIKGLAGGNPMDYLAQTPRNYLGVLDRPDPRALRRGHWYFERRTRTLVYLVQHKDRFSGGLANPPRVQFAVRVVRVRGQRRGRIEGVQLSPLQKYRWHN